MAHARTSLTPVWEPVLGSERNRATNVLKPIASGQWAKGLSPCCKALTLRWRPSCARMIANGPNSTATTGWHPLTSLQTWKNEEDKAMFKSPLPGPLLPPWRLMLLSDGSVTRHLQLLSGRRIEVDCLEMENIRGELTDLPQGVELVEGPRLQRQVFLRTPAEGPGEKGQALVYASSWWTADRAEVFLKDTQLPIWASLRAARAELHRDIHAVYLGHSEYLAREFGEPGPFWGRHYIFWHDSKPLTLIYEVFSPTLQRFLGPAVQSAQQGVHEAA